MAECGSPLEDKTRWGKHCTIRAHPPSRDRYLRSASPRGGERLLYCDHVEHDGEALFRLACQHIPAATPVVRFGRSASYRARALPPRLFQATLPAFLQPADRRIVAFVR